MNELNSHNNDLSESIHTHTRAILPVIQKIKSLYLLWFQYYSILPKTHRHSLGQRIDTLFIEIIEAAVTAAFLTREQKLPFVQFALRKVDTIKVLLEVLWETRSLDNKKYIALSEPLNEIGKMFGGWSGQLIRQNSPDKKAGEK